MREYKEMYMNEQYKALTSYKRKIREAHRGPGRIELQMVCWGSKLPQHLSGQQPRESPSPKLQDLDVRIQGSQMKLPRRVVIRKPNGEYR